MSKNAPTSVGAADAAKRHPEFCFDDALIAIQVEDTLFNVHKYQLLKSETFSDLFKLPKPINDEPEGSSLEHPIVMQGVKASDFVALLKVLYASQFSTHQLEPEASLVIPAFRLANMWGFSDLRAFLLPLADKHLSDIDKILFAREFDIGDWLASAHIQLCQRQEKLTTEEAHKLGIDSLLLIARLGQQSSQAVGYTQGESYCDPCQGFVRQGGYRTCASCQGKSGYAASSVYNGPGNFTPHKGSNTLETEVKDWVRAGCVFKGD